VDDYVVQLPAMPSPSAPLTKLFSFQISRRSPPSGDVPAEFLGQLRYRIGIIRTLDRSQGTSSVEREINIQMRFIVSLLMNMENAERLAGYIDARFRDVLSNLIAHCTPLVNHPYSIPTLQSIPRTVHCLSTFFHDKRYDQWFMDLRIHEAIISQYQSCSTTLLL
jgi:hypothetical protein